MSIQGKKTIEKRAADGFIDGVVAADVFTDNFQFTIGDIENSGGVNSASARKIALLFPQLRW